jgi:Fic family protein
LSTEIGGLLGVVDATATRDLRKGVEEGILTRKGIDRVAKYQKINK